MRFGQPSSPVHYASGGSTPAVRTWDGAGYTATPVNGAGPHSTNADMAYDRARRVLVLWDHGCGRLVMGFTGGCVDQVDQTCTWNGRRWSPHGSHRAREGSDVLRQPARPGGVRQRTGAGLGLDGRRLAAAGPERSATRVTARLGTRCLDLRGGYDEGRRLLAFVLSSGTWTWDGGSCTKAAGGIDLAEGRADAHLVYDRANEQLVYVGSRFTFTWDAPAGSHTTSRRSPRERSGTTRSGGQTCACSRIPPRATERRAG